MISREVIYSHENTTLKGYFSSPSQGPNPCVLIAPAWSGRNQFVIDRAHALSKLGYAAFALDMYGDAKLGSNKKECASLMAPLMEDRFLLRDRILQGLECARNQSEVAENSMAAIGYCFGGLCALDLARSGVEINGVVSFHGLLDAPPKTQTIQAKVLALHGYDDPMAPPEKVLDFAKEMTKANADWQMCLYGNTVHAFTNPLANDPDFGTVYNEKADHRSWQSMTNFLKEVFG